VAHYSDKAYQRRARQAVIELGAYFTSQPRLRRALDLGAGAPGHWFDGALPKPPALARIERFLVLARQVDVLSGDKVASGRFFAQLHYSGHGLDDPEREQEILDKAEAYFRGGPPPVPARSEWLATLIERHPDLLGMEPGSKQRAESEPQALTELLEGLVESDLAR
jgi:hypothetical protein